MKALEKLLGAQKDRLEETLRGAVTDTRRELEAELEMISELVDSGKLKEARVRLGDIDDILDSTTERLGRFVEHDVLRGTRDKVRSLITSHAESQVRRKAIEHLGRALGGPIGGLLAGTVVGVLHKLFTGKGYERIDLTRFTTEKNQDLLAKVIASATIVQRFHEENAKDRQRMKRFYDGLKNTRTEHLMDLLKAESLDSETKIAVFGFLRQSRVLTPGQRNLLQDLVRKVQNIAEGNDPTEDPVVVSLQAYKRALGAKEDPVDPRITSEELLSEYGMELLRGLLEANGTHKKIWRNWYPKTVEDGYRLQVEPEALIVDEGRRTAFREAKARLVAGN